jgi:hypothetical protein
MPALILLAVCLLLGTSSCTDSEEPVILPSDLAAESEKPEGAPGSERDSFGAVDEPPPVKRPRTVVVERVKPFLEESFILDFVRNHPKAVNHAFLLYKDMVSFPNPDGSYPKLAFAPDEVKIMRREFVAVVQRAKIHGKRRFVEDLEIFAVFHAAFEEMSAADRNAILALWREAIGTAEPSRPVSNYYPLFWIRESLQLWTLGGRNWWWGWHGLQEDPEFGYNREEGAWYTAPDGTLFVSRKP